MKPKPEHTDFQKQIVFLCGTPRAGTSALTNMLNKHPEVFIGMERFHNIIVSRQLKKEHFDCNRFINIIPGDTHKFGGLNKQGEALLNCNKAKVLGEKFPKLFQHYDYIFNEFPVAQLVYIIRNPLSVAESYEFRANDVDDIWPKWQNYLVAIKDWNESVQTTLNLIQKLGTKQICLVEYETIFSDYNSIQKVFQFLDVHELPNDVLKQFFDKYEKLKYTMTPKRDDIRLSVAKKIDWNAYNQLLTEKNGSQALSF